jgi:hypothetical protein
MMRERAWEAVAIYLRSHPNAFRKEMRKPMDKFN